MPLSSGRHLPLTITVRNITSAAYDCSTNNRLEMNSSSLGIGQRYTSRFLLRTFITCYFKGIISRFGACARYVTSPFISTVYETIRSWIQYSWGKFTFENFTVSCESVVVEIRFFIRIPFLRSDFMYQNVFLAFLLPFSVRKPFIFISIIKDYNLFKQRDGELNFT